MTLRQCLQESGLAGAHRDPVEGAAAWGQPQAAGGPLTQPVFRCFRLQPGGACLTCNPRIRCTGPGLLLIRFGENARSWCAHVAPGGLCGLTEAPWDPPLAPPEQGP